MMIHRSVLLASILSALFYAVSAFLPTTSCRETTSTCLHMATALAKTAKLNLVKSRAIGRFDLASMVEEDDDEIATYASFAEADDEEVDPPKTGQTITGTVIEIDDNGALLEIGGKMSGYLPLKEAALIPIKHVNEIYQVGSEVTAEVIGTLKGMPVISLRPSQLILAWEEILKIRAADATFDVKVLEINRGGAVCDAFGLKAFLPGSHYIGTPDASIIGLTFKVLSILISMLNSLK